ncbi:MAG: hypothetical protein RIC55_03640 [Pirellulaceae bacterium]
MSSAPGYPGPPHPPPPQSTAKPVLLILLVVFGSMALVGVVCVGGLALMLMPAISAAREAANRAMHKNELRQLGVAYQICWDQSANGVGPQSWEEIDEVGFLDPEAIDHLKERKIRVVWGLNQDAVYRSQMPSGQILLAYPDDPSLAGEYRVPVLMTDGSVDEIPYDEIARRLKAWQAEQGP